MNKIAIKHFVFLIVFIGNTIYAQWSGNDNQTNSPANIPSVPQSAQKGLTRSYLGTSIYGSTVKNVLVSAGAHYLKDFQLDKAKGYALEFGIIRFAQGQENPSFFNFNMALALGTISSRYTKVNLWGNQTPDCVDDGVGLNYKLDFLGGKQFSLGGDNSLQYAAGLSLGYVMVSSDEMNDFILMGTPMVVGRANLSNMYINLTYQVPYTAGEVEVSNFLTFGAGFNF